MPQLDLYIWSLNVIFLLGFIIILYSYMVFMILVKLVYLVFIKDYYKSYSLYINLYIGKYNLFSENFLFETNFLSFLRLKSLCLYNLTRLYKIYIVYVWNFRIKYLLVHFSDMMFTFVFETFNLLQ